MGADGVTPLAVCTITPGEQPRPSTAWALTASNVAFAGGESFSLPTSTAVLVHVEAAGWNDPGH